MSTTQLCHQLGPYDVYVGSEAGRAPLELLIGMNTHRLVALFVLLVFTPASALAGASLSQCVGANGHNALEFVLPGMHHLQRHHEHDHGQPRRTNDGHRHHQPHNISASDFVEVTELVDCVDCPLLTSAQQSPRIEEITVETEIESSPLLIAADAFSRVLRARKPSARDIPPNEPLPDRQLATLRTVILLQ